MARPYRDASLSTLAAMDLRGAWRARAADDEVRRTGVGLGCDDSAWDVVNVPGHWRLHEPFRDSDGPVLYRTGFHLPMPEPGSRAVVTLHGVFYQADVWLDGAYLGDPEGYFMPHTFDVTDLCRLADDHVLAVEVTCPSPPPDSPRRTLTGAYQDGRAIDSTWNPGGLWRTVTIDTTGPVRIDRCRVLCRDANTTRAHLRIATRLDSDEARTALVTTLVDGVPVASQTHTLALGSNEIAWNFDLAKPRLWWPWSMGEQPLVEVDVVVSVDGVESDRHHVRTGLREIAFDDWIMSVNGERLFTKGVNLGPAHLDVAGTDADAIRRDVELAREAGLDLVRVRGHIAPDPLYDAADELGMLIWQDMPLVGAQARSVRRQAVQQARAAVDLLGHHPSIVIWCGHDAPESTPLGQQLPTWNRTILDRWVKRALEQADESRPVIAASGVPPHLPTLDGTDTHLRLGWGRGSERDLPGLAATMPRLVRFVGSFGSQSVPDTEGMAEAANADTFPALDWERLERHHGLDVEAMFASVPPGDHSSFDEWRDATQRYQATLLRHHIETLRRLKYRPTGGFCVSSFGDPSPMVSNAILDHLRHPKLAFAAVVDACRPVIVVAERLPDMLTPGGALALDVHVVSDLHRPLDDVECTATLRWAGGEHEWRWRGAVGPDECVRIGTIQFVVPDAPGELWLDLVLDHGDEIATNRYEATVVR